MITKNTKGHNMLFGNSFFLYKGFTDSYAMVCAASISKSTFSLALTTYDNLSMFDAYYKTLSSRVGENGLHHQTNIC